MNFPYRSFHRNHNPWNKRAHSSIEKTQFIEIDRNDGWRIVGNGKNSITVGAETEEVCPNLCFPI